MAPVTAARALHILLLREAVSVGATVPSCAAAPSGPTCAEARTDEALLLQFGAAAHLHRNATAQGRDVDYQVSSRGAPSSTVDVQLSLKEKIRALADVVMTVADNDGNAPLAAQAKTVLEESAAGMLNVEDVEKLEEEMPASQSAETAAANGMLFTLDDVSMMSGGIVGEEPASLGAGVQAFQGDMIPADGAQLALFQQSDRASLAVKPWTAGSVKFCFASDIKPNSRRIFNAAVAHYEKVMPCLAFVDVGWKSGKSGSDKSQQACQESPAIFVTSAKTGCHSYVGQVPTLTSQQLNLQDPGCISIGTALHELGHALGMTHVQARPDRDAWLTVKWSHIKEGKEHDFDKDSSGFTDVPYDYLSVMHFGEHSFAADKTKPSIVSNIPLPPQAKMGQRIALSAGDVTQISALYAPEVGACEGTAVVGEGCINRLGPEGVDICSAAALCTGAALESCCACHGGIKVLCYEGQACPGPKAMLPPPKASDCIVAKTSLDINWAMAYGCVYENVCNFDVSWTCPSLRCTHTTSPGGFKATSCDGVKQTQICNPGVCDIFKS